MRRLLALVALVLAGSVGSAQATTIDFENLPLDIFGTNGPGADRTSGGFLFDSLINHSHVDGGAGNWGTSDGTKFLMIDNVGGDSPTPMNNKLTFSPTGGGTFTLDRMNISEAGGSTLFPGCCSTYAPQVVVTGNLFGGGTVSSTLTLDFDRVTNPVFGFETLIFDSSWNNLSSVALEGFGALCCGSTEPARGNYWAVDDIVVDNVVAAVPEPGTLTLLGLGSAYLIRRRRRNCR